MPRQRATAPAERLTTYDASWDLTSIPDEAWAAESRRRRAAHASSQRLTYGSGGRPRSDAPRCACQAMTLKRAQMRGKSSDHDPSCDWYRERAIIV